jgi:hypothetical protein
MKNIIDNLIHQRVSNNGIYRQRRVVFAHYPIYLVRNLILYILFPAIFHSLVPPTNNKPAAYIAQLLHQVDLPELAQMDTINQIQYFLEERAHLMNQVCVKKKFLYLIFFKKI